MELFRSQEDWLLVFSSLSNWHLNILVSPDKPIKPNYSFGKHLTRTAWLKTFQDTGKIWEMLLESSRNPVIISYFTYPDSPEMSAPIPFDSLGSSYPSSSS